MSSKKLHNAVIATYGDYNNLRYSAPWVTTVDKRGNLIFDGDIGRFTGNPETGEGGMLVVSSPALGMVYAYGQRDFRGAKNTQCYARWDGSQFLPCTRFGKSM